MKVAVVSDVHGNLTALEAVVSDIRRAGADLIVNGGDLVGSGARPAEVVDLVETLGWPGVIGNTDEVLWNPAPLHELAERMPQLESTWAMVFEDIERTRSALGDRRIQLLRRLPDRWSNDDLALVHASPGDTWNAPAGTATDDELAGVYGELGRDIVVFGHLHVPSRRRAARCLVANSGSVGMPYDGDPRASYALIEDGSVTHRRVPYDIEAEVRAIQSAKHPHAGWIAATLRSGSYIPPPSARG